MATTRVGDITINFEVHGEGEPLLLINGLADDITAWALQTEEFARHYRTIVFDNRGIGGTDKPAGRYTTAQLAADARGLLDALDIGRAHVLGVSMGGMIAQEFALAYPERVDRLILGCTCSAPSEANLRLYNIWEVTAPILGLQQMMKEVLLWCFTPEFFQNERDTANEFDAALSGITQPVEAYLSQLNSIQTHNATARLPRIAAPTLVLGGPSDLIFPPHQSRQLHDGINGSRLAFTDHGGHAFMWEVPDEFNQAVLSFLSATE